MLAEGPPLSWPVAWKNDVGKNDLGKNDMNKKFVLNASPAMLRTPSSGGSCGSEINRDLINQSLIFNKN